MSRLIAILLAALMVAAALRLPTPPGLDPPTGGLDAGETERFSTGLSAYCPWALSDDNRRSSYIAVTDGPASLDLSFMEGGEIDLSVSGEAVEGLVAKVDNPRQIGVSSAVLEFSGSEGAAGVVAIGEDLLAGDLCPAWIPATWHLPGGSTLEGERLVLRLFNPFTADARVDLWALSELGSEADDRLEALTVPARRSRIVVIDEILNGRESLSIIVRPSTGSVIPVMSLDTGTDSAVWAGTAASEGWEFPLASVDGLDTFLVLTNEASLEVNFLIEVFDEEGASGTPFGGNIEGPGQVRVPLSDLPTSVAGVRVTGDGPFGAAVVGRSETSSAVTPGVPTNASTWLVPGPGAMGADARIRFLNTGATELEITYTALGPSGEESVAKSLRLSPRTVTAVALPDPGVEAVIVTGDGLFTVGWWAEAGERAVFGGALPGG